MGTRFLWDPIEDNIVKELDDSNAAVADYTTEPYLYGNLISQERSGQSRFYHFDGLGSTTELSDSSGNITDTRAYSAFGDKTESAGSTALTFQHLGRLQYATLAADESEAVRERLYTPSLARWHSPDSKGLQNGSPYVFAENNPPSSARSSQTSGAHFCRVNLTCTRLAVPGIKHCGIEVTETTGTTQFHVAAPNAGPPDRCVITNGRIAPLGKEWLAGYQTFSTWTDASGELCRCIRRSVLIFNAVNLPYFPVPFNDYMWDKAKSRCVSVTTCNSNYATRCIMNRCGMELITENGGKPWWIDPPGWDFRVKKCTDGREVRIGVCAYGFHFYCSCAKWDNVDEALCGFNRNTRITEQPGPYPKSA